MVAEGNLSPDPSAAPDENFMSEVPGIIIASSSDSEEEGEQFSYEGYEVLPQEVNDTNINEPDDSDNQENSSDEAIDINLSSIREPPSFDESTKLELNDLWNSSGRNRPTDIVMDSTKEEQIKNAMAGFQLPSSAIPPWAAHIPEEEWKEQLISRVAVLNKVTAV